MNYTPPMPDNTDNVIDSRDVIHHIEELRYRREAGEDWDLVDNDSDALEALEGLAEEGETLEDWEYGVQVIRDSYFITYAEEFANDIGAINEDATAGQWPLYCIDWERAARELQMDYTPVEFDGVTYWAR